MNTGFSPVHSILWLNVNHNKIKLKNMIRTVCSIFLISLSTMGLAQKKKPAEKTPAEITIPLKAENWSFREGKVEFTTYKNTPAMKILPEAGMVVLKNFDFRDGTIEFDHEPLHPNFASFYFHYHFYCIGYYLPCAKEEQHSSHLFLNGPPPCPIKSREKVHG